MWPRLTCVLLGLLWWGASQADVRQAPEPELRAVATEISAALAG